MLFFELRKNQTLAAKRHPMFEQNRLAKFFIYFGVAFWAVYFIFIGVIMSIIFKEDFANYEPYDVFNKLMLIIVAVDFFFRFLFQKPPVQEIKPYILLPVSKKKVMDCICLQTGLSSANLFWFFLLLPFAILTIPQTQGVFGLLGFLFGYWLLFLFNNYSYLICRTLISERIYYLFIPLVFFGSLLCGELFLDNCVSHFTMILGEWFIAWNPFAIIALLLLIALLFILNRNLQLHYIYKELGKTEVTKLKHVSEYKYLDRFGEIGEYLRLEIKLQTRNKVPKAQFRLGIIIMLAFSFVLAFTSVYDGAMTYFILVYNFAVLALMTLSQVMSYEGNYLDGLMSRKESVLSILKAKYYLNCFLALIPFLIMFIPASQGKFPLLAPFAMLFFTTGCLFFVMFQIAPYNKKSMNLNMKVMGKNSSGSSLQMVVSFGVMIGPLIIIGVLNSLFNATVTYLVLMILGIALTLLHPWWLRNIYARFMERRYENMDGFRNSR